MSTYSPSLEYQGTTALPWFQDGGLRLPASDNLAQAYMQTQAIFVGSVLDAQWGQLCVCLTGGIFQSLSKVLTLWWRKVIVKPSESKIPSNRNE